MLINNIDYEKTKKIKSEYTFLDLKTLVNGLKLDTSFNHLEIPESSTSGISKCEINGVTINPDQTIGFISKKYYSDDYSYSYPPIGPIPSCFKCNICSQIGPNYHTINCSEPFEESLYLTARGAELLLEKQKKFPKEYSFLENIESNIPYTDIVRKRGQKKIHTKSVKGHKFQNNIELRYQDNLLKQCIIRISKNGAINIISAQFNNSSLPNKIIDLINNVPGALVLSEFQKVYPGRNKIEIIRDLTYKYLIQAQFNLIQDKDQYDLNLGGFYDYIKNNLIDQVSHLEFNNGDRVSRSGKQTNPILQFSLEFENLNVSVAIYKKGAVQLRGSYITKDSSNELGLDVLTRAYDFIKGIKISNPYLKNYSYKVDTNEYNTIDSGKPKECRIQDRPEPYAFNGKCKEGYYVAPWGKKRRADGLYEPCCYKITNSGESSMEAIKKMAINGFPDQAQSQKYEIDDPDTKAAVFYPGTTKRYQRRFKGLKDLNKKELSSINNINSFGTRNLSLRILDKYTTYLKLLI